MKANTICAVMKGAAAGIGIGTLTFLFFDNRKTKLSCMKKSCRQALRTTGALMEKLACLIK